MITSIKEFYLGSIKRQLIIGIAIIHAIMLSIFVLDLVDKQRDFLMEQHDKKAKSLSQTLASSATSWVLSNDFIGLNEVVTSMLNYPGIKYILVSNLQGQVLAHSDKQYVGKYLSDKKSIDSLRGLIKTKVLFENKNYIDVTSPILRDNQHIGWARIALSKNEINEGLYEVKVDGILYTFLAIIIGIFFAYLMASGINKGLNRILSTIKKVKDGEQNVLSNLNRIDEIGLLSKEFDGMILKISEQNTLIDSVFNSSPDLIFYKDYNNFNGVYLGCNEAFCEFIGKNKSEIIGKTDLEIFEKDVAKFFREKDKKVLFSKKPNTNEEWVKYPDGTDILLETLKTPLYHADRTILGVLAISRNITQKYNSQKEIEDKNNILIEQSKLASMGEMIGNIAHQWRQPLSVISTGATGLKVSKDLDTLTDDFFIKTCDMINDNAQYLSKTIDDFRSFIQGDRKKVEFSLSEDINSFLNLVEGSIKNHDINLVKNIDDNIIIEGYSNELMQCFINLFNNAKDSLHNIEKDRYLFIDANVKDSEVTIIFKDNGEGIPENILANIFEPYFTTKHKSQGTGLGLSMTYNLIVNGMHGTIKADNTKYKYKEKEYTGARFIITLPLKQPE